MDGVLTPASGISNSRKVTNSISVNTYSHMNIFLNRPPSQKNRIGVDDYSEFNILVVLHERLLSIAVQPTKNLSPYISLEKPHIKKLVYKYLIN